MSGETWIYGDQAQAQGGRNNVYSYFIHCVLMKAFLINLVVLRNHSTSSQLVFLLTGKTTQIEGSGVGAVWIYIWEWNDWDRQKVWQRHERERVIDWQGYNNISIKNKHISRVINTHPLSALTMGACICLFKCSLLLVHVVKTALALQHAIMLVTHHISYAETVWEMYDIRVSLLFFCLSCVLVVLSDQLYFSPWLGVPCKGSP